MALFKSRKKKVDEPVIAAPAESIEVMRRRARHRLIGAVVLVLVAVVGFPILFDTQPRPVAVDIPIEIPDRNKAKPLPVPVARAPAPAASVAPASAAVTAPPVAKIETPAAKPEAPVEAKTEPKPEPKPEAKPEPKAAESAKAQALLEGKPVPVATAAEGRFVVQVGAFSDVTKARETRLRVERAGLKTYTNVAETKDGRRIRVRVGPFANRAEADKAADKIKGLDLPAAILTL
jgi:DedD protein